MTQHAGLLPRRSGDRTVPSQLPSRKSLVPRGCPLPATVARTVSLPRQFQNPVGAEVTRLIFKRFHRLLTLSPTVLKLALPMNLVRLPHTPIAQFCHAVFDGQPLVPLFWNPVQARRNVIRVFRSIVRLCCGAVSGFWNDIQALCVDVRVFWNAIPHPMNPVFNDLREPPVERPLQAAAGGLGASGGGLGAQPSGCCQVRSSECATNLPSGPAGQKSQQRERCVPPAVHGEGRSSQFENSLE